MHRQPKEVIDIIKRIFGEKEMRNEEYLKARRLAEEALVDARLAESKANSEMAKRNAAELQKTIESLRAEAQRGSSR